MTIGIENLLPKIVITMQKIILKGRCILNNLISYWEYLDWAKYLGQQGGMFIIHYENIEWIFLMILEALGFLPSF